LGAAILADSEHQCNYSLRVAHDWLQIGCWQGLTACRGGATFFHVGYAQGLMAKKNIYIKDDLHRKMAAEAERRGITFSHACSLAFESWLNTMKQIRASVEKYY